MSAPLDVDAATKPNCKDLMSEDPLIQDADEYEQRDEDSVGEVDELVCDDPDVWFVNDFQVANFSGDEDSIFPDVCTSRDNDSENAKVCYDNCSQHTESTTVTNMTIAISRLRSGVWSEHEYQSWIVDFFRLPVAPYCDFKRYTRCCDIDISSC